MPMMTPQQYEESLRKLNLEVYMFGKRIENVVDDPIIRPSMNAVAKTYELAQRPEYRDIMVATSHISGNEINRFTHIHQSTADLVAKSKMGRLLGRHTGCCFQRCVGMDSLNALSIVTYNMDAKYKTAYYQRFLKYLAYVQEKDLTCDGAMTDPKGNRRLPPHAQPDPDLYLHVVAEKPDGIVVRGAKAHQTGAVNSHEIIVMPTMSMKKEDADYAVSFALPSDTNGILYIMGRQSCDTRKSEGGTWIRGTWFTGGMRRWWFSTMFSSPGIGCSCTGNMTLRASWWSTSPPITGKAMPAKWALGTSSSAPPRPPPNTTVSTGRHMSKIRSSK